MGEIRENGQLISFTRNQKTNYLDSKYGRVHEIMAQVFVPNPYNYNIIDHINNNKLDNRASNLEWCSKSANTRKAHKDNLVNKPRGINNCKAKMNDEKVREIRVLYATGKYGVRPLGKIFGVQGNTILRIVKRKTWAHVE